MNYQQEKFLSLETFFNTDNMIQGNIQFPVIEYENSLDLVLDNSANNIDFFSQCPKDQDTSQLRSIEQQETSSPQKPKSKKQRCHCKKTRCLKMYCECFSQGITCTKDCVCVGCHNDDKHHKDKHSRDKNAETFQPQAKGQLNQEQLKVLSKGCNCKKSRCEKKYCQCKSAGLKCSDGCQCLDCNNGFAREDYEQKYKSSSSMEKKSESNGQEESQTDPDPKLEIQVGRKEQLAYVVMSNELLAEIDGYLTA